MAAGIEIQVGAAKGGAFAQATTGRVEAVKVLLADSGDGTEKEVTLRSTSAGASSEAPASSGIPSTQ